MKRQQSTITLHAFFSSRSGSIQQAATSSVTGLAETQSDVDSHDDSDLPQDSRDPESVSDSESENESERIQHTPLHTMSEGGHEDSRELLLQPNQPRLKSFPPKQFGKKKIEYRSFNSKWFDNEKCSAWLHWDSETEKSYCFMCRNIYLLNQLTLSKCTENAFISSGFDTWKNATKAFERHRKSACHQEAVLSWHHHLKRANISTQFDQQIIRDHQNNRHCLEMLFTSVEYLARQALPFRGHSEERGNFYQLVALSGSESDDLKTWMRRTRSYMSHNIQNEILQIMAHQILELSKIFKYIAKKKSMLLKIKSELAPESPGFKPLCPTRWTVRAESLRSVIDNYPVILLFCQSWKKLWLNTEDMLKPLH